MIYGHLLLADTRSTREISIIHRAMSYIPILNSLIDTIHRIAHTWCAIF